MPEASLPRRKGAAGPTSEAIAGARKLYETTGLSEAAIAARSGVSRSTLRARAARELWRRPDAQAARQSMVRSLRMKIEREMAGVEAILGEGVPLAQAAAADRAARTLASLVRTLRELAKYDQEQARATPDEDDDVVTDLDGLRDALADRLDRLRREHGG